MNLKSRDASLSFSPSLYLAHASLGNFRIPCCVNNKNEWNWLLHMLYSTKFFSKLVYPSICTYEHTWARTFTRDMWCWYTFLHWHKHKNNNGGSDKDEALVLQDQR